MFSFRKIGTPTLAALLMVTLPWSALAEKSAVKAPPKEQAKEQAKEQPKVQPKEPAKEQPKEQPKEQAKVESKSSPAEVMVRVNGIPITRFEVERAVKVMLAQSQMEQPVAPEIMQQAEAAALEQLTAAELLYQEAAKLEVKDLDKEVAERVAQNRAKFSSEAEFEKALNGVDMTAKDMLEFTRKDIIISNFIEKSFSAKAAVSEADAKKFYDENLEKYFTKPESARASHILIGADEKTSAEERKKAKEKAEALLKRVKGGEEFAALAKAESSCPSSAQGGDLGNFTRGQMVPAFETAAFALKPGEVSDVVETQFGYHIVKLTEKQEGVTEKFDDVKGKITEYLKREKIQKDISSYVDELRKSSKIEKP